MSEVVSGFTKDGKFKGDNWNCPIMNKLRKIAEDNAIWNEDQYCALIPIRDACGAFLVLSWYKRRGETEGAWVVDENKVYALTIDIANSIIEQ